VVIHDHKKVIGCTKNEKREVTGLMLQAGDKEEEIEADLVIFGVGVKPVTSFMHSWPQIIKTSMLLATWLSSLTGQQAKP